MNLRTIKSFLKKTGITNKEVTKYKGEYWVLHICKNNAPVPLFHSKSIKEAFDYLKKVI